MTPSLPARIAKACGSFIPSALTALAAGLLVTSPLSAADAKRPADRKPRVVSVGGAVTEIIYALGGADQVVATDTTSYYPEAAKNTPKVGYQRQLTAETILSFKPTLVIVTTDAGPKAALEQLKTAKVNLKTIKASRDIADIKAMIVAVASAIGKKAAGDKLLAKIAGEEQQLAARIKKTPLPKKVMFLLNHGGGKPRAAGTGTAAESVIAMTGSQNAVTGYKGYKTLTPEALITLKPDVLLMTNQGVESLGGVANVTKIPGVATTPAAANDKIIVMDALEMLGFGPRTVATALKLHRDIYGK